MAAMRTPKRLPSVSNMKCETICWDFKSRNFNWWPLIGTTIIGEEAKMAVFPVSTMKSETNVGIANLSTSANIGRTERLLGSYHKIVLVNGCLLVSTMKK